MNDLIQRQDAIDAMVEYVADGYAESPNDFEGYMGIVKELPSAEPKIGKWIEAVKDGVWSYSDYFARCDQCHKVKFNGWGMNYCPNCGAKMRGEEE